MDFTITMPYIGGILTDNNYKIGKSRKRTRPQVSYWMRELAEKVRGLEIPEAPAYTVKLYGKFWDEKRPDLHNLHKVVGDALEQGLAINDKFLFFADVGYELAHMEMELDITIVPRDSAQVG